MGRRGILLVAAVLVAVVGVALVFLYVRGADQRAEEQFETAEVLVATQQVEPGETVEDALAAGKFDRQSVVSNQVLPGATNDPSQLEGLVAITTLYPGEQATTNKFGGNAEVQTVSSLPIPDDKVAISVNLTDTSRVAGFVSPGSEVAIFFSSSRGNLGSTGNVNGLPDGDFTTALLSPVTVLAVGSTTQVTTTTTSEDGGQVTEALPRTLITLALAQKEAEKVLFAQSHGELAFALLKEDSEITLDSNTVGSDLFDEKN